MEENRSRSYFLQTIQTVMLVIALIGLTVTFIMGYYIIAVEMFIVTILSVILLQVFKVIIDLLQSIDEKLDR